MKTQNKPTTEFTESTRVQTNPEVKDIKASSFAWQAVLVGGVPGILIGALADDAFAKRNDSSQEPDVQDEQGSDYAPETHVTAILEAHSVSDDMSFSEAFAAARAEVGPGGAFVWHGHVYGTYRADDPEWQAMSDEQRTEHSHDIMAQVHPSPYTPTANEPAIVAINNQPVNDIPDNGNSDSDHVDVHIVGVDQGHLEDGTLVTVGYGAVDGQYAEFVDSDGDGEVDTVLIDVNSNGQLDNGETINAQGSGITVEDLFTEAQANSATTPDDSFYDGMPAYTNDADTSSYV